MPYEFVPKNPAADPLDRLPQHLEHKPFYALPYQAFDGPHAGVGETDMRFISVGIAQYDPDEISIKTMRRVGRRWTRQAEELPLHRAVDMALFLANVLFNSEQGAVNLPSDTLPGQTSDLMITQEERTPREEAAYNEFMGNVDRRRDLAARFNNLLDCLSLLKEQRRF